MEYPTSHIFFLFTQAFNNCFPAFSLAVFAMAWYKEHYSQLTTRRPSGGCVRANRASEKDTLSRPFALSCPAELILDWLKELVWRLHILIQVLDWLIDCTFALLADPVVWQVWCSLSYSLPSSPSPNCTPGRLVLSFLSTGILERFLSAPYCSIIHPTRSLLRGRFSGCPYIL